MNGDILTLGFVATVAAVGLTKQRGSGVQQDNRYITIQKGAELYYGTSAKEDFKIPNGPVWLTDCSHTAEDSAAFKKSGGGPCRVLIYRVTTEIPLVLIKSQEDEERLEKWLEEEHGLLFDMESSSMVEKFCSIENGLHMENDCWSGSQTLLCDPGRWLELVGVEYMDKRPRGWRK
jgi:hypothetical protein